MKPIQVSLNNFITQTQLNETHRQLQKEVLGQSEISSFIQENQLSETVVNRNLSTFYEYITQVTQCTCCPGLLDCPNVVKGYTPKLTWQYGQVQLVYDICDQKQMDIQQTKLKKLVKSMYIPQEVLMAKRNELYLNDASRILVVEKIQDILQKAANHEKYKGLYLSGSFGIGKTFILGMLAGQLAEIGQATLLVYFPEFVREMKSSISDQTLEGKLTVVKSAPVLMLDDIGAESVSSFTRDEILGAILQYRMLEKMPTFFTSNFNLAEMEVHLTTSQYGDEERVKAKRIIERIRVLADPIEMAGENLRN